MNCHDSAGTAPPFTSPAPDIHLDPTDWFLATWRDLPPLPRPEPLGFDRADCLTRLQKVRNSRRSFAQRDWSEVDIPSVMSRPEAHFWLRAMSEPVHQRRTTRLKQGLAKVTFDGNLSPEEVWAMLQRLGRCWPGKILAPLSHFLSPLQIVDLLLPPPDQNGSSTLGTYVQSHLDRSLSQSFAVAIVPYLSREERQTLRERLRPEIVPERWVDTWHAVPPLPFRLAALLGLPAELQAIVNGWPEDRPDNWSVHLDIIFGLGDPKLVELHARRLRCRPTSSRHLRAWLAHTGTSSLDWVEQAIGTRPPGDVAEFLDALCRVSAPAAAPLLLGLKRKGAAPHKVRAWMDQNVPEAVEGLLPLVSGKGKLSELVLDYLRRSLQRGYSGVIEDRLKQVSEEIAVRVRRNVLDQVDSAEAPPLVEEGMTPSWLNETASLHDLKALPGWLVLECLPPLVLNDGRRLQSVHLVALIGALKLSKPKHIHAPILQLQQHIGRNWLDPFAWRLLELWINDGVPQEDATWVMTALGILGGDDSALKLTPLIREWASQGRLTLAWLGLDALKKIGTRPALMELNALAHHGRTRRLRERAMERTSELLRSRRLKQDELDDLSVPDLGLDRRGSRAFDFGPRCFHVHIGPNLKPIVREESGKRRAELPRPRQDDDPHKTAGARREWGVFRKQLRDAVKLQSARLERSLINGRRWSFPAFAECILRHPLLSQLARSLLWGSFEDGHELRQAFRLSEDGTFADAEDRTCSVDEKSSVGLIHPVHLTQEGHDRWSRLFGDYEIVPPFAQLGRPVHRLEPGEEDVTELRRFPTVRVSDLAILATLGNTDWVPHWHGMQGRLRYFAGVNVTAALSLSGYRDRIIDSIRFYPARIGRQQHIHRAEARKLSEVDAVVLSEVLADVIRLAARGTQMARA